MDRLRAIVLAVQPRSNLPWKKDAPPVSVAPRFSRQVDVKRVALAAGVLTILTAGAVWAIAVTFRPGPVQRLEAPTDAAPYPVAPAVSPDSKRAAAPARAPRTNASSRQQNAPATSGSDAPPPPSAGSGSRDSLAPIASSSARPAAAPRAVPLPPPELRFETFEQVRDQAIYSARDADVSPPVPVFPKQLGRMPRGARREDVAMIEVLVNADGTVAAVKAQESPQSLDDALVLTTSLSAAKSWLFQPAQREGRPVRYRRVLPVSLR